MKSKFIFAMMCSSLFSVFARADIGGGYGYVSCPDSGASQIAIYSDDFVRVAFFANPGEAVKPFQGWGTNERVVYVDGREQRYVRVQFPNHENEATAGVGWLKSSEIKDSPSACLFKTADVSTGLQPIQPDLDPLNSKIHDEDQDENEGTDLSNSQNQPNADEKLNQERQRLHESMLALPGLKSAASFRFPLDHHAYNYHRGKARFGAHRTGRTHAGADLYGRKGELVHAVAQGYVIRGPYYFYGGTFAVEVEHSGGFVVRYGEILGASAVSEGMELKRGDVVGHMGKVKSARSSCCAPMLHFEMYAGTGDGPLTQFTSRYDRRADLLNPTKYLDLWQSSGVVAARRRKRSQ